MSINSTKKTLANYSAPLCEVIHLESSNSLLASSPAGSTINDWLTDPDVINL